MKVYHGSYKAIENVDFSFCRRERDFGKGFYVTKLRQQAEYWAERKGLLRNTAGVVTEFDFDENAFDDEDLKALRFEGYNNEWLDFIVLNRLNKTKTQIHDYDIIEGPIADDDVAARVYDYMNRKVSQESFLKELAHKTPTHQICFCSMRSLQALDLDKAYVDVKTIHIDNDVVQALMSDYGIDELEATKLYYISNIYSRLANENTEYYKKSWQEIYEMLKKELQLS
jgi:hypothetical protein